MYLFLSRTYTHTYMRMCMFWLQTHFEAENIYLFLSHTYTHTHIHAYVSVAASHTAGVTSKPPQKTLFIVVTYVHNTWFMSCVSTSMSPVLPRIYTIACERLRLRLYHPYHFFLSFLFQSFYICMVVTDDRYKRLMYSKSVSTPFYIYFGMYVRAYVHVYLSIYVNTYL